MCIESRASNTAIGSGRESVTVSSGSFNYDGVQDNEYKTYGDYGITGWGQDGTFFTYVDFYYRLPVNTWNGGSNYAIPSTADVLRFYFGLGITDATTSVCHAAISGGKKGSGNAHSVVESVSLLVFGEEYATAAGTVDVVYPVKSQSLYIGNTSVVLKIHCMVYGSYVPPSYTSATNIQDGYMTVTPKLNLTIGNSSSTIRIYDYAGKGVTDTDITDQTKQITDKITDTNKKLDDANKTSTNIFKSITDFFGSFFKNLIDSVVSLFVPSAEEMGGLFDQLNQFFSDRFGFLYAPFDYMIQLMNVFLSSTGSTGLTFPGFSIMGYEVWGDLTYDLSSDPLVGTICGYVRTGTGILLAGYFIMFLQNFFKERFGSG